ncbi:VWA domain-containing protein [Virgibacillus sp. C22-A2]|uniref:VWA domain-containing protein n=1 Tax=Virgibacillus tibetensis TaxID=3042313 RepID=A0ABU6KIE5_9BACI|nr:VWA domain-containing protein [Virgibacillus sp. C22-A2]
MNFRLFSFILIITVLLFGCSKKDESTDDHIQPEPEENISEETESDSLVDGESDESIEGDANLGEEDIQSGIGEELLENIPRVPQDTAGFINQIAGSYAGVEILDENIVEDVLEDVQKLEPLSEDANEEQVDEYFDYLYSLVAEDFPNPQDTIKKWEFSASGDPDLPDSRYQFKENYNIEVLLDASGSMGAYIGDKTMMEIAKDSIHDFMKQVPEDANVSFRVYGHEGTGSQEDKGKSCAAIEQVYGYAPYKEDEFQKELDKIEPAGWTPLASVLEQAEEALQEFDSENSTNLIYVVSDGVETCDGDPVKVAKSLADSNAEPIINIIGFNVNSNAQKQLKEMAEVSGGVFSTANNQDQLKEEFNRAEEVLEAWEKWRKDAIDDVDASRVGGKQL